MKYGKAGFLKKFFNSELLVSFVIRFFIFSIIFFVVWIFIGKYYLIIIAYVSKFILGFMGYDATLFHNHEIYFICRGAQVGLTDAELANYNIVPFLALVFATPKMNKFIIGKSLLFGLPVIFTFHVANMVAHFPYYYNSSSFAQGIINSAGVINMGLPFLLWILFYRDYVSKIFKPKSYICPICGERKSGIAEHIESVHKNLSEKEKKALKIFFEMHPELKKENGRRE